MNAVSNSGSKVPPEQPRKWLTKTKVVSVSIAVFIVGSIGAANGIFDLYDKTQAHFHEPPQVVVPLLIDASWPTLRGCDGATAAAMSDDAVAPQFLSRSPDRKVLVDADGSSRT